ncbi:MAG TPA: hypothetical protein VE757_08300 [Gaiellaceae bacterium]|nr:hypothetical protein [Gaiellaceae bacterium]
MRVEPQLAFCVREVEPPGVEVRVNFGVFAGRAATPAEIDELAKALLPKVGEVTIVAEERHEIAPHSEASLNLVRVEVAPQQLPDDAHDLDLLCGCLVEAAEQWAHGCIAERHADVAEL